MTSPSRDGATPKRFQRDHGWPQTGQVDVNQIVVAPDAARVAELKTAVGADATGEVLAYTGTTRLVGIDLEVTRQHLVRTGATVTVTLADGGTVTGTVTAIADVAAEAPEGSDAGPTVHVTVTITDQRQLGNVDGAPVSLTLVVDERKDVLTVSVGALVALAEGGYGMQVVQGSTTSYLPVETGMFEASSSLRAHVGPPPRSAWQTPTCDIVHRDHYRVSGSRRQVRSSRQKRILGFELDS